MNYDLPLSRGALADQEVREVGARELCRHTADVLRSVADRRRIILTRHGKPQALLVSINDAIELLVEPRLAPMAAAGDSDYREGRVERVEPPGPFPIVLAVAAADAFQRMSRQDRRELRAALARGTADDERPVWLRSRRWMVWVSYPDSGTVLVYAAFEVRELEREVVGEEIWEARARRDLERRLHARDLDGLPA